MEPLDPADPHRIGPYRLLSRLGAGGTGQVYLARSDRGRTVAVTLVRPDLALREEFRVRFRQEVAAARRVGGDWTAPVLDADTEAEVPWFATGHVAGPSLRQAVARDFGPLPPRTVRVLATGLTHALRDIHRVGLIHRDLKPSNVLLTLDGPRVIGFGIAGAPHGSHGSHGSRGPDGLDGTGQGSARPGMLVGSLGFTAPEQARGEPITPACDVFHLGAVLAYAATGRMPFGDAEQPGGAAGLLLRVVEAEADLTGVPADLLDLVRACLLKDPAARPTSAEVWARFGAGDTATDVRALEPWLPMPLVALLGRRTVALLDREDAGPDRPPPPRPTHPPTYGAGHGAGDGTGGDGAGTGAAGRGSAHGATYVPTLTPTPLLTPAPAHGAAHGSVCGPVHEQPPAPPPRPHRAPVARPRRAPTAFLAAVAAVVAVAAGATVHTVLSAGSEVAPPVSRPVANGADTAPPAAVPPRTGTQKYGDPKTGDANTGTAETGPAPDAGPAPDTGTADTGPTGAAAAGPVKAALPDSYAGAWRARSGTATWHLTLTPGTVGDPVMDLRVEDPGYSCTWRATLLGDGDGVELAASTVISGAPATCTAGGVSRLRLLPDGSLRRELTGSAIPPLTYDRE
ncbi:serine/threonine-protein kinase [Streptomyces sp. NPDC002039]|uniref:serine/threonine-protein kinase n=1 Tax=Streptomyces sp. NPDC002039 TaxID=3154660 RepID=UPI00332CEEAE